MRKFALIVVVVAIVILLLPLSNRSYAPVRGGELAALRAEDAEFAEVAGILERKCAGCHVAEANMPFYAGLPLAGSVVQGDVRDGLRHMDMMRDLWFEPGAPISQAAVAKVDRVLREDSMPPSRFLMMHWNGALSEAEQAAIRSWIAEIRHTTDPAPEFLGEAVQPLPRTVRLDEDKVALGNRLYHDVRLSGDNTISCASCHDLSKGGTDQAPVSTGIAGQLGPINSPTTFNSGTFVRQFWDGRAATLEEQAAGPVHNPLEMGSSWDDVIGKLEKDREYVRTFARLYPRLGLSGDAIVDAIAVFERSLHTPNSRFDRYLRGEVDAIDEEEKQGYALFKELACDTCHVGPTLGGESFERMGLKANYFEQRGNVADADLGLANFTGRDADRFKFKVPTLRNIALTQPYFHDGQTTDLTQAVRTMARYQRDEDLDDRDAERIALFLNTLTGEYNGQILQ